LNLGSVTVGGLGGGPTDLFDYWRLQQQGQQGAGAFIWAGLYSRETMTRLEVLITPALSGRNRQPVKLAANQFLKFALPTCSGLRDEEES